METRSDNSFNIRGKALNSNMFDLESCAYVKVTRTMVPHNTAPTAYAYGILESRVENSPDDTTKSRLVVQTATQQVSVVDKQLEYAWGELQRFAPNSTVTKDVINGSSVPAGGFLVVVGENKEINPNNFKRTVVTVPSWSTRVVRRYDEQLGVPVVETLSVVAAGTALPASTSTSWSTLKQVDDERAIQSSVVVNSGAAWSRTTYETINMSWPALFRGYTPGNGFEPQQRRSIFTFNPDIRAAFSGPCNVKTVEELITAAAAATLEASVPSGNGSATQRAELWLLKPQDIVYNGVLFDLNVPNVICNALNIAASTNSEDTYYGYPITDTYTGVASSPTYTQYAAAIGTEKVIEDSIRPFEGGNYIRTRRYIVVQ